MFLKQQIIYAWLKGTVEYDARPTKIRLPRAQRRG